MRLRSGSDPVSWLLAKFSSFKLVKLLMLGGTGPIRLFLSNRRTWSVAMPPNSAGIEPDN
uniref:Uncharacterized protein n=1 Tax=Arundo donax TaxID=35708 RepID=A0A0A8ZCC0_ARUDO